MSYADRAARKLSWKLVAISTSSLPCVAALAQQPAEQIVVTGSRVARIDTFSAPTPVTVVDSDFLETSQPSTLAASLNTLPALFAQGGPNAGRGNAGGGRNILDLRSVGQSRTLILVDGRRVAPSSVDGLVDTNLIPAALVSQVELVTGGAAATYGSDAVAGVVNFKLDTGFTGFKGSVTGFGRSEHNDFKESRASLTYGESFADGRGHYILSAEYYDNDGVAPDAREFRRNGDSMIRNPDPNGPTWIRAEKLRLPATSGGLIVNGVGGTAAANAALRGIQFGPGGTPLPYDYGTLTTGIGGTSGNQSGGDGFNPTIAQQIVRPLERSAVFARVDYDLTDDLEFFAQAAKIESRSFYMNSPNALYSSTAALIQSDNAFLPASIRDQMLATGVTGLRLTRYIFEGEYPTTENEAETNWILTGLNGSLGNWNWTVSLQRGWNDNDETKRANTDPEEITLAIDAVVSPANGSIVCRSTLTNPTNGCVPVNLFGQGSVSEEALAYYNHTSAHKNYALQEAAEFNIGGDLFDTWTGPVSASFGVEYRKLESEVRLLTPFRVLRNAMPQPWKGEYSVKELFAEAVVPLADSFELSLASRATDYSVSGSATTWKVGGSWAATDSLRLRATRSRDIRAPNLADIFEAGTSTRGNVNDPFRNGETSANILALSRGNPSLQPEEADTLVVGAVYRPQALPGLGIAVDYYKIDIADAIAGLGRQQVIDQCFAGNAELCDLITRNDAGLIVQVITPLYNFETLLNKGVDIEVTYSPERTLWGGNVSLRGIVGYVGTLRSKSPAGLDVEQVDSVGREADGIPRLRGTFSANYDRDSWSAYVQTRYVGGGKWNNQYELGVDTNFNDISAQIYTDAQVTYRPRFGNGNYSVFLNLQNVFDRQAVFAAFNNNTAQYTNPNLYDEVGRVWRLGFRWAL